MNTMTSALRFGLFLCPWLVAAAPHAFGAGDRIEFAPKAGAKTLKNFKVRHELRIDDTGMVYGDLPYVSDGTGGWISTSHKAQFLDEYVRVGEGKPLEFVRQVRDESITGKANVTRPNGQVLTEQAPGVSPLRRFKLRFTWIDTLGEWSRCYSEFDGEENWLSELRGECEFLELLPKSEVEVGAQWSIAPEALRSVLAPGGNHKITPTTDKLFGRLVEIGVGGDFADALGPEIGGSVSATYRGQREIEEGDGDGARRFRVAEIEYEINLASTAERKFLYVMAMPEEERREPARIDGVPLEFGLLGKATLLWDLDAGRAHSFRLEGQESFVTTVSKTRFDGRQGTPVSQVGRYSGPLVLEADFSDGADVGDELEAPKRGVRPPQKR